MGCLATGINSGVTGFGADVMVIDDPVKDAAEADSTAHRRRVVNEYRSTLATRVHPGGSVLLVMTRWNELDLAGELARLRTRRVDPHQHPRGGRSGHPRRTGPGIGSGDDVRAGLHRRALSRRRDAPPANGHGSPLYQGVPSAPAGGLVKREWLDTWRLPAAPRAR